MLPIFLLAFSLCPTGSSTSSGVDLQCSPGYLKQGLDMCVTGLSSNIITKMTLPDVCNALGTFNNCAFSLSQNLDRCALKNATVKMEDNYREIFDVARDFHYLFCATKEKIKMAAEAVKALTRCLRKSMASQALNHHELCDHLIETKLCYQHAGQFLGQEKMLLKRFQLFLHNITDRIPDMACHYNEMKTLEYFQEGVMLCKKMFARNKEMLCKEPLTNIWNWYTNCVGGSNKILVNILMKCKKDADIFCGEENTVEYGLACMNHKKCVYANVFKYMQKMKVIS